MMYGCYLPYLWLKKNGSPLVVAACCVEPCTPRMALIAAALLWLWKVDQVQLTAWDFAGAAVALVGMGIIAWGGWRA